METVTSGTDGAPPLRVLVVDDHPLMASAVADTLARAGMEVVATLSDAAGLPALWRREHPDVVVCDASLHHRLDGIDAARALLAEHPDARVLVYSAHTEKAALRAVADTGITGYVRKSAPAGELVRAIRAVAAGREGYDQETALALAHLRQDRRRPHIELTPRERDVLEAMCRGSTSTADLCAALNVGPETVRSHVASLATKLDVHDRAGIVAAAFRAGLVPRRSP